MSREPEVKLGTLELWIHGRQYDDAVDYWDGNWLNATARCSAEGALVEVSGPFIINRELYDWAAECRELLEGKRTTAELSTIEPELKVSLAKTDSVGHIEMVVHITPDHMHQEHKFTFEIDQSYLPPLIASIERLAERFPLRGTP